LAYVRDGADVVLSPRQNNARGAMFSVVKGGTNNFIRLQLRRDHGWIEQSVFDAQSGGGEMALQIVSLDTGGGMVSSILGSV
jgi:hypothetical protein